MSVIAVHEVNLQGAFGTQRRAHNLVQERMGFVSGKASWRKWHLSWDLKDE